MSSGFIQRSDSWRTVVHEEGGHLAEVAQPKHPRGVPTKQWRLGHTQRSGYAGISPFTLWRNILSVEGEMGPL